MIQGKENPGNPFPSYKPEPSVEGEQAEARYIEQAEVGNTELAAPGASEGQQAEDFSAPVKKRR